MAALRKNMALRVGYNCLSARRSRAPTMRQSTIGGIKRLVHQIGVHHVADVDDNWMLLSAAFITSD